MMNLINNRIKVGDRVPVVIDREVQELEVIDLPRSTVPMRWIQRLAVGTAYPAFITVKLPNGSKTDCRLLRPARF